MTILETIPQYSPPVWLLCCLLISLAVGAACGLHESINDPDRINIVIIIICLVVFIPSMILMMTKTFHRFDYNKYIVEIKDDVSVSEVYDKYEIISKEKYSNIYTVKDKSDKK